MAKFVKAKATTGLPYAGLLLYLTMVYLLKFRWLRPAKSIGKLLQGLFSTNYSVNSVLAGVYSQMWNPNGECKALMRIVPANRHDIDLLARSGLSAAYAGDVVSLAKLRDIAAQESPSLLSYFNGLLAFLNEQADYPVHFQESVRLFFNLEGAGSFDSRGKSVSISSKRHVESDPKLPEFVRLAYNVRELASIDEPLMVDCPSPTPPSLSDVLNGTPDTGLGRPDVIVLISCSEGYLDVFSDYFIRTFRRKNSNIIHFHVLAEDVETTRDYLVALKERHSNIRYSIEAISGKSQTYITLARYLICRDLMRRYNSDVLISDIDLRVDFDLRPICRELKSKNFDFGLCDAGYSVPWAKFAAGLSYFRVANHATDVYLELLSTYLTTVYSDGGFWTMDQTGMLMAHECMQARGHDFKMLNLYGLIDFRRLITVPKQLQRRKIKCKFRNGGPQ
ncbi:MAG: hypothetical protein O3B43_04005 [Chloroflexi bacterium]|nr:hypothetical protein [Chloroflexota bacterium]